MGKKTPLYSGGNNPTVTPKTAPQRAVLPQEAAVLPLPRAVLPWSLEGRRVTDPSGTAAVVGRYYRSWVVLPPYCRCEVPHYPTRKMTTRVDAVGAWYRSGTTAEDPPAVLPLRSGTAACDP